MIPQDHGALPERAVALIAYEVLQVRMKPCLQSLSGHVLQTVPQLCSSYVQQRGCVMLTGLHEQSCMLPHACLPACACCDILPRVDTCIRLFVHTLCGWQVVEKCHELGILHGDLKPANFVLADRTRNPLFSNDINLLFGEPWLLAIDFGCSQYLGSQRFTKRTGTPGEAGGGVWQEGPGCGMV